METIEFCRKAYVSSESYYKYLKSTLTGIDVISVFFIKQINHHLFKLRLSKKTPYVEYASIVINSSAFPEKIEEEVKIYDYNESDPSITVLVSDQYIKAFTALQPQDITLESDLTFLVNATKNWYHKYHKSVCLPASASMTVGRIASASETQQKAIETALSSNISYIWGAPGTGKTQFVLANCILSYIKKKKKVLIMAPTNNALEQSLRGVLKILEQNGIGSQTLLRLGRPSYEFSQQYPNSCELQSLEITADRLKKEIEELTRTIELEKRCTEVIAYHKQFEPLYREYKKLPSPLEQAKKELDIKAAALENSSKIFSEQKTEYTAEQNKLNSLTAYSRSIAYKIKSYFSPAHRRDTEDKINELAMALALKADLLETASKQYELTKSEHEKASLKYCELQEKQSSLSAKMDSISVAIFGGSKSPEESDSLFNDNLTLYKSSQSHPRDTASLLAKKQKELNELISLQKTAYSNRDIFACTVDYAILHYEKFPDGIALGASHLFVDEAAYIPLSKSGVLFSFGIPVTLLGDHMQLPPVCEMSDKEILTSANNIFMWAQSAIHFPDIFSREITYETLYNSYANRTPPTFRNLNLVFLNETYRFGKNIAAILDNYVYHSGFSGKGSHHTKITVINAPRSTDDKVFAVSNTESDAIQAYLLDHPEIDNCAIITPYKKQIFNISQKLGNNRFGISTIHASQGREWDTVIISVVDSAGKFFMDSNNKETDGLKIINTAISRAKKEIIFVLDYARWKNHPNQLLSAIVNNRDSFIDHRTL